MKEILWWTDKDFNNAVKLTKIELSVVINCNPNYTITDAKKHLYQPKEIINDKSIIKI